MLQLFRSLALTLLVVATGPAPIARHSHAAALVGNHMYVHGGSSDYTHTCADLHALDLTAGAWQCLTDTAAQGPAEKVGQTAAEEVGHSAAEEAYAESAAAPACFSHTLTAVRDLLVVAGGCHTHGAGGS